MKSRIHHYFPTDIKIPDRIDFVKLVMDESGYKVHVVEFGKEVSKVFQIDFKFLVRAQRSMDESSYLAMSWDVEEMAMPVGPIALVTGSDFLEWFYEQSCGVYERNKVFHVAILTQNEWIEVLCLDLPTITILETVNE